MGGTDGKGGPPGSLTDVWTHVWDRLARGVGDRRHAYHTMVVGTVAVGVSTTHGVVAAPEPRTRTVVTRDVDSQRHVIVFHTDARSEKIGELRANPSVSLLLYDPATREQIRARAHVRIVTTGPSHDHAWQKTSPMSRRTYLVEPGPGTVLDRAGTGLAPDLEDRRPSDDEGETGRDRFVVVECVIHAVDWLRLTAKGHYRALWQRERPGDGEWSGHWVIP
jgi:pyridoxamine 5'-phosphate oxidase